MSGNFVGNRLTQSKLTHLMTSLVPGLRKRKLHFLPSFGGIEKNFLRAGTELKFENYESVQHRLQFSGIKKEAKISFPRHFKLPTFVSNLIRLTFWVVAEAVIIFSNLMLLK